MYARSDVLLALCAGAAGKATCSLGAHISPSVLLQDKIKEEVLEVEGHIGCVLDVASVDEAQEVFCCICHSSLLQLADAGTCIFFMASWASALSSSMAIRMLATTCCHENLCHMLEHMPGGRRGKAKHISAS